MSPSDELRYDGEAHVDGDGRRPKSYIYPSDATSHGQLVPEYPHNAPSLQRETMQRAVSSAFDDAKGVKSIHDPDLVAAITASVIRNLKQSGIGVSPTIHAVAVPEAGPPRDAGLYTPPLERHEPPHLQSTVSSLDIDESDSQESKISSSSTSQPPQPSSTRVEEEHFRPRYTERAPTDDTTTLEKIWQPLFDGDGRATRRLGQFLRGLAIHIIEDYEPRRSLVIPPPKMLKFYECVPVNDEHYPWNEIFGGKLKHSDLSHIYRDMDCEHHFIQQSTSKDRPTVPALTPTGFERWMTLLIMSDPNLEYQRFTKAVLNMPISNADDTKERFPKELSRRLFPKHSDTTTRILVDDSIYADGVLTRLRDYARDEAYEDTNHREETMPTPSASTFPLSASKPPCQPHPAASPSVQVQLDRERSFTSSEAITDDTPTSISIERERKPYRAQPGGGKVYENGERLHQRSNTTSGGQRPTFEPVDDYSVSHRYRSGSATAGQPPPPPPPIARQRYRSPSTSQQTNLYSRSDSTVPIGGSYATGGFEDDDGLRRYLSGGEERQLRYRNEDISRDFYGVGPPRTSYEEEQGRRPKATYDYPPPPPPQYR